MTRHTSSFNNNNDNYPNRSFFAWMRSNTGLFIAQMVALISIVYTIIATIYYIGHNDDLFSIKAETIQEFVNYAHLLFVLIVVVILFTIIKDSEHGKTRAKLAHEKMFRSPLEPETLKTAIRQVRDFKLYFLLFWVSIGFLYVGFLIEKNVTAKHKITSGEYNKQYEYIGKRKDTSHRHNYIIKVPADTQYIEGFKIDSWSQHDSIENYLFKTPEPGKAVHYIAGEWMPLIFNIVSSMFIFWCYSVLYSPKHKNPKRKRAGLRWYSILVSTILILSYPLLIYTGIVKPPNDEDFTHSYLIGYITTFNCVSGLLNSVVLSLLIGRLDSKLIGLSVGLVSILYVYAAVQPLFVVFSIPDKINENIKTFVLLTVFSFKIYFFLIIVYILQSGRLLNYLCCFPTQHTAIDSIWGNEFEIIYIEVNSNLYKYEIRKSNHIVFKTDLLYESRDEVNKIVEKLRKIMTRRDAYFKFSEPDAPRLEIKDSDKTLCFSVGIKTKRFNDFIEECINKIPSCKIRYC